MNRSFKVFVAELFPPALNQREMLEEIAEVKIGHGQVYKEDELIREIQEVDGVLVTSKARMNRKVIDAGKRFG